jgi:hypothetical protein
MSGCLSGLSICSALLLLLLLLLHSSSVLTQSIVKQIESRSCRLLYIGQQIWNSLKLLRVI